MGVQRIHVRAGTFQAFEVRSDAAPGRLPLRLRPAPDVVRAGPGAGEAGLRPPRRQHLGGAAHQVRRAGRGAGARRSCWAAAAGLADTPRAAVARYVAQVNAAERSSRRRWSRSPGRSSSSLARPGAPRPLAGSMPPVAAGSGAAARSAQIDSLRGRLAALPRSRAGPAAADAAAGARRPAGGAHPPDGQAGRCSSPASPARWHRSGRRCCASSACCRSPQARGPAAVAAVYAEKATALRSFRVRGAGRSSETCAGLIRRRCRCRPTAPRCGRLRSMAVSRRALATALGERQRHAGPAAAGPVQPGGGRPVLRRRPESADRRDPRLRCRARLGWQRLAGAAG